MPATPHPANHSQPSPGDPPDPAPESGTTPGPSTVTAYSERLRVPLWWWIAGLAVAILIAVEVKMSSPGILPWIPYVLLLPFPVWALLWLGRVAVEVVPGAASGQGELRVGNAHLPVDAIARVAVVPASAKSAALGRQLDPSAFVQNRTWIGTMILIVLDDPDDPTPYWLVSTRHPHEVAAALGWRTRGD